MNQRYAEQGFESTMLELATQLEGLAEERYVQAVFIAMPFAMAGDADKAVKWLGKGFEQHDPQMPYVGTLGGFDPIRNDAGYQQILSRMNLSFPGK